MAGRLHEVLEELAQLRRTSSEIDGRGAISANPITDPVSGFPVHHLGAPGGGIDVAMAAGLVALTPDVDLEGVE